MPLSELELLLGAVRGGIVVRGAWLRFRAACAAAVYPPGRVDVDPGVAPDLV